MFQIRAVQVLGFDLEDGDLVDELFKLDRGLNALKWQFVIGGRSFSGLSEPCAAIELLLKRKFDSLQDFIPISFFMLAKESH